MKRKVTGFAGTDSPMFREETLNYRIVRFAIKRGLFKVDEQTGKPKIMKSATQAFIQRWNEIHNKHFSELVKCTFPGSNKTYLKFR